MLNDEDLMKENDEIEKSKTIENNSSTKNVKIPILYRKKNIRSLIIKKMGEEEKFKDYIKTEINDYFNSPDKYFDINSPISINKKIDLKEINLFQKPINNRHLTNKRSNKMITNFSIIKKKSNGKTSLLNSFIGNNNNNNINNNINTNINNNITEQSARYEIIDNEKLRDIFESYQEKNSNNKKPYLDTNNLELNNNKYPIDLSKSLSVQSNRLKSSRNNQKNVRQLSGYLSKRLNKKEKDLLIHSIDSYRYKKELINDINHKQFSEIHPRYYWKMNLRRGKDMKRRDLYVNIKNNYDPFFAVIVDNYEKKKELRFKSGLDLNCKELNDFKKNKYLIDNYSNKINNLENLETLNIKGRNLFDVEYKREMSSKRRKILHKVFIENGKEILDTDINEVFGPETIYKNYPKEIIKYEKKNISNSNLNTSKNTNNL